MAATAAGGTQLGGWMDGRTDKLLWLASCKRASERASERASRQQRRDRPPSERANSEHAASERRQEESGDGRGGSNEEAMRTLAPSRLGMNEMDDGGGAFSWGGKEGRKEDRARRDFSYTSVASDEAFVRSVSSGTT